MPVLPRIVFLLLGVGVCLPAAGADPVPTPQDIFRVWRARQARTETVDARVDAIIHYAKQSQFVPGESSLQPTSGRSTKASSQLRIDGPAKFFFRDTGFHWHRRFGRILELDWSVFSNGNLYVNSESAYDDIPTWSPKPRLDRLPRLNRQQMGWENQLLTPLLQHYRPFNSRHCSFADESIWMTSQTAVIGGVQCVLLTANLAKSGFSIHQHQYWVAPDRDMAVMRIERLTNGDIECQYDITYAKSETWQPESYQLRWFRNSRMTQFVKANISQLALNQPIDTSTFRLPPPSN